MQIASPHCKGHLLVLVRMKSIRLYHQVGQWYKVSNNDPLDGPLDDSLGSLVKMVKTVNMTCLMTRLLTFHQYPGFAFASGVWSLPCLLPDSLSMIVVFPIPTFFAMALIDYLWSGGKLSLAFHKAWA